MSQERLKELLAAYMHMRRDIVSGARMFDLDSNSVGAEGWWCWGFCTSQWTILYSPVLRPQKWETISDTSGSCPTASDASHLLLVQSPGSECDLITTNLVKV